MSKASIQVIPTTKESVRLDEVQVLEHKSNGIIIMTTGDGIIKDSAVRGIVLKVGDSNYSIGHFSAHWDATQFEVF